MVIIYVFSAPKKDIYDQLMRSRFRLYITCALEEKRIKVLENISYLLHANYFPDCFLNYSPNYYM